MNYIILDLEWNQSPNGQNHPRIPFEIIEIGAVKVNEELKLVDTFSELIRPRIYRQLHYKVKEICNITMNDLKKCREFPEVIRDFLDWCGEDMMFCTWGSMDLTELQRNMHFHKIKRRLAFPLFYEDVQNLFSLAYFEGTNKVSLSDAVEHLDLKEGEKFHRAVNDAKYTLAVMQKMNFDLYKQYFSIDCYYVPNNRDQEIYVSFDNCHKYVSRKFRTKEEAAEDARVRELTCQKCGKKLKPILPWFSDNSKTYYSVANCPKHGLHSGVIRMKKCENGMFYATKVTKPISIISALQIKKKQDAIREKRREKRARIDHADA